MERKLGILFAIVLTLGVAQAQTTQKARDYYNSAAVHFRHPSLNWHLLTLTNPLN